MTRLGELRIFISYSHKDEKLRQELETHLKFLEIQELSVIWHDRKIAVGREWTSEIDQHLDSCHIILLLISADFIASDYCYCVEVDRAMQRHYAGEARVIPIILRRAVYDFAPFHKLKPLPEDGRPIYSSEHLPSRDEAFYEVAKGVQKVVEELIAERNTRPLSKDRLYDSLLRLDYRQQGDVFAQFLDKRKQSGVFLIHGESGYGQDWLLNRLLYRLSERLTRQVPRKQIEKVVKIGFSKVRKGNIDALWREIAYTLGLKNSANSCSPEMIVKKAYELWKYYPVVFIVRNLKKFGEECIKCLLEDFWSPLMKKSKSSSFNYCLMFLVDEDDCVDSWVDFDARQFDFSWEPCVPIKLSRLTKFDGDVLRNWIDFEYEAWPTKPMIQDVLGDSKGIPESVLDNICKIFGYDWYEESRTEWIRY